MPSHLLVRSHRFDSVEKISGKRHTPLRSAPLHDSFTRPDWKPWPHSIERSHTSTSPDTRSLFEVEAVEGHHFVPRLYEVVHKFLLAVSSSVDFRDGTKSGVRPEDEVEPGPFPLDFARLTVA